MGAAWNSDATASSAGFCSTTQSLVSPQPVRCAEGYRQLPDTYVLPEPSVLAEAIQHRSIPEDQEQRMETILPPVD